MGRIIAGSVSCQGRSATLLSIIAAGVVGVAAAGCANNTETGMLAGGAGGAGAGAAIGSASGHAGTGALIGGAVGLIGGGLIGNSMDQDERDRRGARSEQFTASDDRYASGADHVPRGSAITSDDVLAWSKKGTSDEVIIDRIERSRTVFGLTAADESRLREQGVSDDVLRSMRETSRR